MKKIDKIKSLRDATRAGHLRGLKYYDTHSFSELFRFDFYVKSTAKHFCVYCSASDKHDIPFALYACKKAINKWILKNRAGVSDILGPETPYGCEAMEIWGDK